MMTLRLLFLGLFAFSIAFIAPTNASSGGNKDGASSILRHKLKTKRAKLLRKKPKKFDPETQSVSLRWWGVLLIILLFFAAEYGLALVLKFLLREVSGKSFFTFIGRIFIWGLGGLFMTFVAVITGLILYFGLEVNDIDGGNSYL